LQKAATAPTVSEADKEKFGGKTPREQLERFLTQNLRNHGVCHPDFLKQMLHSRQQEKSKLFEQVVCTQSYPYCS
jgi:hypothetical protein